MLGLSLSAFINLCVDQVEKAGQESYRRVRRMRIGYCWRAGARRVRTIVQILPDGGFAIGALLPALDPAT